MRLSRRQPVGVSDEIQRTSDAHRTVLAHCFSAEPGLPLPSAEEWAAAAQMLVAQRLAPIVLALRPAVVRSLPEAVASELRAATFDQIARRQLLLGQVVPIISKLKGRSIPFLVIKGPAVARFYPRPPERGFVDVDLLVRRRDFTEARLVLESAGLHARSELSPPWPWFDTRCREGLNLADDRRAAIDLHHRIPPWCFSEQLTFQSLRQRADVIHIGDIEVLTPSAADSAVISGLAACNDLYKRQPGLLSWKDLSVLCQVCTGDELATSFRLAGLSWLYDLAGAVLGTLSRFEPFDDHPEASLPTIAALRLILLGWSGPTPLARHPLGWFVRLPPANALAFLVGSAIPSPAFARRKHGGYLRYWSECVDTLVETARGTDFRSEDLHRRRRGPGKQQDAGPPSDRFSEAGVGHQ